MNTTWECYKKRLFELKMRAKTEMMMSDDKLTMKEETKEEIEKLKKEMRQYKMKEGMKNEKYKTR